LVRASIPRRPRYGRHAARSLGKACDGNTKGADGVDGAHYLGLHQRRSGWTADFKEGVTLFRSQRSLKLLATTVSMVTFCQGMVFGLLVFYGRRILGLSPERYGIFMALASLFGVAGAFCAGSLRRRFGPSGIIVGGALLATVSYLGLAFTRQPVLAVFVFGLQELGIAVANVGSVTIRQEIIPRKFYGRVGSVHRLIVSGATPVGALFGGAIAAVSGVPVAFFVAGALEALMLAVMAPALVRALRVPPVPWSANWVH
jgi:predicted MFS family arabinose efflux permease